jgi:hypothetical protein
MSHAFSASAAEAIAHLQEAFQILVNEVTHQFPIARLGCTYDRIQLLASSVNGFLGPAKPFANSG